MLTLAAHDVPESFLEKPNIFDIARSAGFKTFWLCNLVSISDQNMVYTPITKRADVVVHTSIGNIQKHDAALFNAYQAALNDPAPKKLIVLQLIGNHHDYENTYPKNATVFPLDSEPSFFTTEQKKYKKIVNAYDNSVRYNDFILEEFISRFEKNKSPGFLIYCPDHGENLHESPGMIMHMEFMPTVHTVEIPMYIYLPPNNKDKELVKKATSLPFASEDLPYLLMDLGKLKLNGADMSKSPLSPQYKIKKRIVSNCGVDYEKLKIKGHGNLTNLDLR
jgi:heptose-I-phosphate ethanolaminephosphotransferase